VLDSLNRIGSVLNLKFFMLEAAARQPPGNGLDCELVLVIPDCEHREVAVVLYIALAVHKGHEFRRYLVDFLG
jgi:hypothetical protein